MTIPALALSERCIWHAQSSSKVVALQAILDMLGGSSEGVADANLLPWAQLAWGAGGDHSDTAVAASIVQRLDWQEMAFTLPGMSRICYGPLGFMILVPPTCPLLT